VHQAADEYCELTDEQKQEYLREYNEHEETKQKGEWISNRSKSNDITHTMCSIGHAVSDAMQ